MMMWEYFDDVINAVSIVTDKTLCKNMKIALGTDQQITVDSWQSIKEKTLNVVQTEYI